MPVAFWLLVGWSHGRVYIGWALPLLVIIFGILAVLVASERNR